MNIVEQNYWDNIWKDISLKTVPANHFTRKLIDTYIPGNKGGSVIEIGCYPGQFLTLFGEKGYVLNGIDLTPATEKLKELLISNGYKVGEIICGDFLAMKNDVKFDVVFSYGFIEHFTNYDEIIIKHLELLKPGGYLILVTPNFKGLFQYFFHSVFDRNNLKLHVIKSMNPLKWKEIIQAQKDFEIKFCGYIGGPQFWMTMDTNIILKYIGIIKLRAWRFITNKLLFFIDFNKINHSSFSGYCGLIAQKK